MVYLDRSAMDHLGLVLSSEYAPLVTTPMPRKLRDWVFQYALAEVALEAERRSREARLSCERWSRMSALGAMKSQLELT